MQASTSAFPRPPTGSTRSSAWRCGSRANASATPEGLAQLALGALQHLKTRPGQVAAGAIDVEGQHRRGRAIGLAFAATAPLGGAFEREGNGPRAALGEDAGLQIERVAAARHGRRPLLRRPGWRAPRCGLRPLGGARTSLHTETAAGL